MSRYVYSAICPKHGYHQGGECAECENDNSNEVFMTNKDRLYNFFSSSLGIKIESKSQWKRELKARGLTDDFNQSKLEIRENTHPRLNREEIKENIRKEMKQKGIYSREKLFLDKPRTYRVERFV